MRTALSMIGKLGITAAFGCVYMYPPEIFPTTLRFVFLRTIMFVSSVLLQVKIWPLSKASPNFHRGPQVRNLAFNFRHHSHLRCRHCEIEQNIWNLKQTWWALMMALCSPHSGWSSVHQPLRTTRGFGLPLKIGLRKCAKSSINQSAIARFPQILYRVWQDDV